MISPRPSQPPTQSPGLWDQIAHEFFTAKLNPLGQQSSLTRAKWWADFWQFNIPACVFLMKSLIIQLQSLEN